MAEYVVDEYGKWEVQPYVKILCEPSELWLHEHALPEPTQAEKREQAYRNMTYKEDGTTLILWKEQAITVDNAVDFWLKYNAEGSEIANTLSTLITQAKAYIRSLYPDDK